MKVVTLVVLLLTIVSTSTSTTIGAATAAAATAGGAADTKADRIDGAGGGGTPLRERQRQRERQLEEVVEVEEVVVEEERESPCPIEMLDPGNTKCNIEKQDGKVCGYEHVWVGSGCSTSSGELELELDCQPSLTCTCNLFYDEYWACAADGMSSMTTCPDGNGVAVVVSSELRGTICTPEGSIEIIQQQQPQDGGGGVSGGGGGKRVRRDHGDEHHAWEKGVDAPAFIIYRAVLQMQKGYFGQQFKEFDVEQLTATYANTRGAKQPSFSVIIRDSHGETQFKKTRTLTWLFAD